jgi:hypothetical protein
MTHSVKTLLLAAAGTGLMSGAATVPSNPQPAPLDGSRTLSLDALGQRPGFLAQTPAPKHACKGQNSCKGQGGCNTGDMGCKGKNSCKGKGGCKTDM